MKIIYNEYKSGLIGALKLTKTASPIISFVGAGGKTSLIRQLSKEYEETRCRHLITTTTHMWKLPTGVYGCQVGEAVNELKLKTPGQEQLKTILKSQVPVLIEADGAKGFPCKVPEAWEPVIVPESTHVVAVVGASCVGRPIFEVCHRKHKVIELLSRTKNRPVSEQDCLTLEDLSWICSDPWGLKKDVAPAQTYIVVINQVDTMDAYIKLQPLKEMLHEKGVENICFVRMK